MSKGSDSTDNKPTRWIEKLAAELTPEARKKLLETSQPLPDEAGLDYQTFLNQLDPEDRVRLEKESRDSGPWPTHYRPRYCAVECLDGHYPVLRIFDTPEQLAEHVGKLDGEDVTVMAYYGVPIPFTKAPDRVLIFGDGRLLQVTPKVAWLADRSDNLSVQEDGFLGLPDVMLAEQPAALPQDDMVEEGELVDPAEDVDQEP